MSNETITLSGKMAQPAEYDAPTGTRALHVTAEELELLRIAVQQRMGRIESHITHNVGLQQVYRSSSPEFHAAMGRELSQRETLDQLKAIIKRIDNV